MRSLSQTAQSRNQIVAALNGIRCQILVDSGSDINAISVDYLRNRLRCKCMPMNADEKSTFRAANGTLVKVSGKVDLNLKVSGLNVPVTYIM